jgi:hypothetical protein
MCSNCLNSQKYTQAFDVQIFPVELSMAKLTDNRGRAILFPNCKGPSDLRDARCFQ